MTNRRKELKFKLIKTVIEVDVLKITKSKLYKNSDYNKARNKTKQSPELKNNR
jgi:hypothetical protein